MKSIIKTSTLMTITLILICGVMYPLLVTGFSQVVFNKQANGSLVELDGKVVGSKLIGQDFNDDRFFRGRVSAVSYNTYSKEDVIPDSEGKKAYNGVASGSANLAPSNPVLAERVNKDIEEFLQKHPNVKIEEISTDLLTSSGSGLDPDISPEAAKIQIDTVAKASGISKDEITALVDKYTESRDLGVLGEPRVNVLMVNLEIASILKNSGRL
ncbi:MAG: K(+)-transporting ATPase subunit C [Clostridiaceae bacterium]